jgi:tRNA threonylcarbamoyladenosine biosynthesis protein TsaB
LRFGGGRGATLFNVKIVAMECGGPSTQLVALEVWGDQAEEVGSFQINEPRALSRLVMMGFDTVLKQAQWPLNEVEGLAIGIGPGSWTSLRIGLSTFKTLAQTLGIPLVGIPTFDAVAAAAFRAKLSRVPRRKKSKNVGLEAQIALALSPCRPGELYGKVFELGVDFVAPAQPEWIGDAKMLVDAAYCQGLASDIEPPLLLCGDGAIDAARHLEERGEEYELAEVDIEAVALEIALAGASQIASGSVGSPLEVAPLYLAPSHAERHLASKSGGVLAS